MMKTRFFLAAALAAAFAFATPATAASADGLYTNLNYGVALSDTALQADSTFISGAVGYDFGWVRTEGEYFWAAEGGFAPLSVDYQGVSANVIVEYENDTIFVPFVKGGVGYAWFDNGLTVDQDGVIYNIGAGVRTDLTENLSLVAEYRHFDSPADVLPFGATDFNSDVVSVGLSFDL